MMTQNRANEIMQRIEDLSEQIERSRHEVAMLRAEVAELTGTTPAPQLANEPGVRSFNQTSFPSLENIIGLKLIHFAGIIVLIIGLSIGVKHAIDVNLITPTLRIILAYATTGLLFFISFNLRKNYEVLSIILFSGSMASAYFTTYAAYEYYSMLPRLLAFGLMLLFTFFTIYNSLKYNRQEIAILGLVGAYAIPFFVGGKSEDAFGLFTYIFLINVGILLLSFKKYWLSLTYISFLVTWAIFLSWLVVHSEDKNQTVEGIFAFIFFLLFLANCLVFKVLKRLEITSSDTVVVVGDTLLLYFSLLLLSNDKNPNVLETVTGLFGVVYLAAAIIVKRLLPLQQHFHNALFSIALTALCGFVALEYDGFTVTIIWIAMAVISFVIGMLLKAKFFRAAAIILFVITLLKLVLLDSLKFTSVQKIIAYLLIGTLLLVVSFLYQKFKDTIFGEE
jgi:uncharacterized membrane protein